MPGASVAVLDRRDQVLLIRRSDTAEWCMPGGAAEEGSSFASTAVKELAEETGLRVKAGELTAFACISDPAVHTLRYPNGDVTHCFALWFLTRAPSDELRGQSEEVQNIGFFDLANLPQPMLNASALAARMLAAYNRTGEFQVA